MVYDERNMFLFTWKIENYSYSWKDVNEYFTSPSFQICPTEGSSWRLRLYPRGVSSFENFTSLYLERGSSVQGSVDLSVDYELSFLKSDGTPGYTGAEKAHVFRKGDISGFENIVTREEIIQTKKSVFLPDDTLTVQCRICFEIIGLAKQIQAFARSTVWIHSQLFLWDTGEFNYVYPCKPGNFSKRFFQTTEVLLDLNEDCTRIYLRLVINDHIIRMFRFKVGIIDSNKSTSNFLIDEYIFTREKRSIESFLILRSKLLQRKDLYLPDGRLILHCELNYSKGIQVGQVTCHAYDKIFTFHTSDKEDSRETLPIAHSLCCANNYNSMKNDFQNLQQEGILCDFTIKVGPEALHVHKTVLCARSSVFRAMLTSSMKESQQSQVDIFDLELDTVRHMLTFMYSDNVDDLDWEMANKLYFAADKYDIPMLKRICTEFLKINLIAANVNDVLTLANTHSDEDLRNVALKFLQCTTKREEIRSCTEH